MDASLSSQVYSSQFAVRGRQSGLDCLDAFAARGDDGLDELVVGVLVAAIHELGDRIEAIGPLVVDAGKIERAERIVRRTDEKEPAEPPRGARQRIAEI